MTNQRKQVFLIFTILIMAASVAAMTFTGQNQKTRMSKVELTARQKLHSKLYKDYRLGKKLPELAQETPEHDVAVIRGVPGKMFNPDTPRPEFQTYLKNLTCDSDAVVVGVINKQASELTEDEDFIFTDYDLIVEQVLRDNPVTSIRPGTNLTITRPGGIMQINNKEVRALDETLDLLTTGNRYLLFLKYLPVTDSYEAFNSNGSFQITGNEITKLTQEPLPQKLESGRSAASLFSDIASANSCQ